MPLSGKEMLKLFLKAGWIKDRQCGSHVIVEKENRSVPIPQHKELKKGTESFLFKILKNS